MSEQTDTPRPARPRLGLRVLDRSARLSRMVAGRQLARTVSDRHEPVLLDQSTRLAPPRWHQPSPALARSEAEPEAPAAAEPEPDATPEPAPEPTEGAPEQAPTTGFAGGARRTPAPQPRSGAHAALLSGEWPPRGFDDTTMYDERLARMPSAPTPDVGKLARRLNLEPDEEGRIRLPRTRVMEGDEAKGPVRLSRTQTEHPAAAEEPDDAPGDDAEELAAPASESAAPTVARSPTAGGVRPEPAETPTPGPMRISRTPRFPTPGTPPPDPQVADEAPAAPTIGADAMVARVEASQPQAIARTEAPTEADPDGEAVGRGDEATDGGLAQAEQQGSDDAGDTDGGAEEGVAEGGAGASLARIEAPTDDGGNKDTDDGLAHADQPDSEDAEEGVAEGGAGASLARTEAPTDDGGNKDTDDGLAHAGDEDAEGDTAEGRVEEGSGDASLARTPVPVTLARKEAEPTGERPRLQIQRKPLADPQPTPTGFVGGARPPAAAPPPPAPRKGLFRRIADRIRGRGDDEGSSGAAAGDDAGAAPTAADGPTVARMAAPEITAATPLLSRAAADDEGDAPSDGEDAAPEEDGGAAPAAGGPEPEDAGPETGGAGPSIARTPAPATTIARTPAPRPAAPPSAPASITPSAPAVARAPVPVPLQLAPRTPEPALARSVADAPAIAAAGGAALALEPDADAIEGGAPASLVRTPATGFAGGARPEPSLGGRPRLSLIAGADGEAGGRSASVARQAAPAPATDDSQKDEGQDDMLPFAPPGVGPMGAGSALARSPQPAPAALGTDGEAVGQITPARAAQLASGAAGGFPAEISATAPTIARAEAPAAPAPAAAAAPEAPAAGDANKPGGAAGGKPGVSDFPPDAAPAVGSRDAAKPEPDPHQHKPNLDQLYEELMTRFRRDVLAQREQMGDLAGPDF